MIRPGDDYDSSPETQFFTCKGCKNQQPLSEFYKTPSGHRHECKRCMRNKRNQKRRAKSTFIEYVDKRLVYEQCAGICAICEERVNYKAATLDHIVPLARGGAHSYKNIQLAHSYCNRRKGIRLMEELDDDLRYAAPPNKKKAYYNSKSFRQASINPRRAA